MEMPSVDYPVDGVLDLHQFIAREAVSALEAYLDVCRHKGVLRVRIIHGRGQGVLRHLVQACLDRHPGVIEYQTPPDESGWGATITVLKPYLSESSEPDTRKPDSSNGGSS